MVNDDDQADILQEFVLKECDATVLKERAEGFVAMVDKLLAGLNRETITLDVLRKQVASLFPKSTIHVSWGSMAALVDSDVDEFAAMDIEGAIFTAEGRDGTKEFFIYLNQNIRALANKKSVEDFSDMAPTSLDGSKAYWHVLKQVYLHELSHLVLKPGEDGLPASPMADDNDEQRSSPLRAMCIHAARLYSKVRVQQDFDCEIFSLALAFWPSEMFTRSLMLLLKHWDVAGSVRAQLADVFHMPVNATAQWVTIMFGKKLGMHYIRREECGRVWLDVFDYACNLNMFASRYSDVFSCEGTAAHAAARDKKDRKSLHRDTEPFFCEALYNDKSVLYNSKSDEIVVVGFNRRLVMDEIAVFDAGCKK